MDDGAQHTICALDEDDALKVYFANMLEIGEWPEERPRVEEIDDRNPVRVDTQSSFGVLEASAFDWQQMIGASTYLACSEY